MTDKPESRQKVLARADVWEQELAGEAALQSVFLLIRRRYLELERSEGLTQTRLAERMGLPRAQISRWFSSPSNLTLRNAAKLLMAMERKLEFSLSDPYAASQPDPQPAFELDPVYAAQGLRVPRREVEDTSAQVIPIPDAAERAALASNPRLRPRQAKTASRTAHSRAWRPRREEQLAAADRKMGSDDEHDGGLEGAPEIQLVPGATDGSACLGYLCGGSNEVVVIGANEGLARVMLDGKGYSLTAADSRRLRLVEGMSRQDVMNWFARTSARRGGFAVIYE